MPVDKAWEEIKRKTYKSNRGGVEMKRLVTRSSIIFIGTVFGLVIGLLIGVIAYMAETAYIDHRARVEQYQQDRAIFYGNRLAD